MQSNRKIPKNWIIYEEGKRTTHNAFRQSLAARGFQQSDLIGLFAGRFMPYHNGHDGTLRAVVKPYDRIHVGIVNPDPWDTKLSGERFTLDKNFLTYAERAEMLQVALHYMCRHDATMGPYYPVRWYGAEKYWRYLPGDREITIGHLAVRDEFDVKKMARHRQKRDTFVQVPLQERRPGEPYGATLVRELMLKGEEWRHLVPQHTADILDKYHCVERLRDLTADAARQKITPQ